MSIIDFYAVFFEGKFSCTLFHQERRTAISRSKTRPRIRQTGTTWRPAFLPGTRLKGCPPARYSQHKDIVVLQHGVESFFGGITTPVGKEHGTSSVAQLAPLHPVVDAQCSIIRKRQKNFQGLVPHQQLPPHSWPDNEAAHKTPPFRTERKGGVSVGKTGGDSSQGYARTE